MNIGGKEIKVIAIDFDGTIIPKGLYPNVGEPLPFAIETIHGLMSFDKSKCKIVLWSCRDKDSDPNAYNNMIKFCEKHGLVFDAINDNIEEFKAAGVKSRKIIADLYIDDNSIPINENNNWERIFKALHTDTKETQ